MVRKLNLSSATRVKAKETTHSIPLTSRNASGDCFTSSLSCAICGGRANIRCFCDTHVWDGIEKRYDQLLYEVFRIRPHRADEMICECCILQLRSTQRFRSVVMSAFTKRPSEMQSHHSKMGKGEGFLQKNKSKRRISNVELLKPPKPIIDTDINKKKCRRKSIYSNCNVQLKRTNLPCTSCKQKYPMMVPFEGWKNFVCSRCKKNNARSNNSKKRTSIVVPADVIREHLNINATIDLRDKNRLFSTPSKPSQTSKQQISTQGSKNDIDRPKRRSSLYLTKRISSTQESNTSYTCEICGKENIKSRDNFDKHMRTHTGETVYQCDVCSRLFKSKSEFQMHYFMHRK